MRLSTFSALRRDREQNLQIEDTRAQTLMQYSNSWKEPSAKADVDGENPKLPRVMGEPSSAVGYRKPNLVQVMVGSWEPSFSAVVANHGI
jgi:hypothetical protein